MPQGTYRSGVGWRRTRYVTPDPTNGEEGGRAKKAEDYKWDGQKYLYGWLVFGQGWCCNRVVAVTLNQSRTAGNVPSPSLPQYVYVAWHFWDSGTTTKKNNIKPLRGVSETV